MCVGISETLFVTYVPPNEVTNQNKFIKIDWIVQLFVFNIHLYYPIDT